MIKKPMNQLLNLFSIDELEQEVEKRRSEQKRYSEPGDYTGENPCKSYEPQPATSRFKPKEIETTGNKLFDAFLEFVYENVSLGDLELVKEPIARVIRSKFTPREIYSDIEILISATQIKQEKSNKTYLEEWISS